MTLGTTSPIYVPRKQLTKPLRSGEGYFWVQVHSAQAYFGGPIWERAKGLVVTSQVDLTHPSFHQGGVHAIQRAREVKRNHATQLGLNQVLVDIVPATMSTVSVSIEFLLDRENRLGDLAGLINSDSFWSAISLAPAAALVARTLSNLAQKVIQTLLPVQESVPILQFNGDFHLGGEGLVEGYYVILGTTDANHPLPSPYEKLLVHNGMLLRNDVLVSELSYVVLNLYCTEVRTREMNGGALWDSKLREAEDEVESLLNNPLSTTAELSQGWQKCVGLLREAQVLIRNDPNYLTSEAENIIRASFARCEELVRQRGYDVRSGGEVSTGHGWTIDTSPDRMTLGVPSDNEMMDNLLYLYAQQVVEARRQFKASGVQ
jgi:hypothetical protein